MHKIFDLIILGAGVSGLSAAIGSGECGLRVLLLDHSTRAGRKLCIAGGGFANVSNRNLSFQNYLSSNPHFCKSVLSRFDTGRVCDFITQLGFELEEREYGQLFLRKPASELRDALMDKAISCGAETIFGESIDGVDFPTAISPNFSISVDGQKVSAPNLLLALGSPAWPQCGASNFGAELLKKAGHRVLPFRPALVPLIMPPSWPLHGLQGISLPVSISLKAKKKHYKQPLLFTHKGISGPVALQISLHWHPNKSLEGEGLEIDFLPDIRLAEAIKSGRANKGGQKTSNFLCGLLPQRLVQSLFPADILETRLADLSARALSNLEKSAHEHQAIPSGNEGMRRAEAASGGADVTQFSSKDLQSSIVSGLYCAGELLDVTGELGGYNIHWAIASGLAMGRSLQKINSTPVNNSHIS